MEQVLRTADLSLDDLLAGLRHLRPQFEALGVTAMTLFGSRARQDNRPDSDIDLMIEVDESFTFRELVRIGDVVQAKFGVPGNSFIKRSLSDRFLKYSKPDWIVVF